MKSKISWDTSSSNEWAFVGEGSDFKDNKVSLLIDSYFSENELYLVVDRHNAYEILKGEATSKIKSNLHDKDIILSNKAFTRMIEFNHIGVAKCGTFGSAD
ncbi:MAG: hypothetical protein AAF512_22280 [Pseudomonadota bacterium]